MTDVPALSTGSATIWKWIIFAVLILIQLVITGDRTGIFWVWYLFAPAALIWQPFAKCGYPILSAILLSGFMVALLWINPGNNTRKILGYIYVIMLIVFLALP
ncbi:MAG: hypothetical protein HQM09_13820 [Candidatus Riflebacteria bacterium]|nr:hypothetical protein [Candidatus Riflebacteria bacterium]